MSNLIHLSIFIQKHFYFFPKLQQIMKKISSWIAQYALPNVHIWRFYEQRKRFFQRKPSLSTINIAVRDYQP